jgi:hypothetical protein
MLPWPLMGSEESVDMLKIRWMGGRQQGQAALWTDNFEPLQPPAFVFGNVDIAFGIHGGAYRIEELAREEKPRTVADRRYDLPCRAI